MNEEDKRMFLALAKGKDISEIMSLLAESGNQYSRRILRFFRWFCKWVPFFIMLTHMYGVFDFSRNPKEMFAVHRANWAYYNIYIHHGLYTANGYYSRVTLLFGCVGSIAYRSSTSSV